MSHGSGQALATGSVTVAVSYDPGTGPVTATTTTNVVTAAGNLILTVSGSPVASAATGTMGDTGVLADGAYLDDAPTTDISSRLVWATADGTIVGINEPEVSGRISPTQIKQGQALTITVPCTNPNNVTGITGLPTGATASNLTVVDASHISFLMTVASNAPTRTSGASNVASFYLASTNNGTSATGAMFEILTGP